MGGNMEKLMFSRERMLAGISRVMDHVGLLTLCRIFAGDGQPVKVSNADEILDIKGCAAYMKVSTNWIHKHSHELPRIQSGKRGRLRFWRSEIDAYLEKHSTPGIPD